MAAIATTAAAAIEPPKGSDVVPTVLSMPVTFDPSPVPLSISHKSRVHSILASTSRAPPGMQNGNLASFDFKARTLHMIASITSERQLKFDLYCSLEEQSEEAEKKETDTYLPCSGERLYDHPLSKSARKNPSILLKRTSAFVTNPSPQVRRLVKTEAARAIMELFPGGTLQKERADVNCRVVSDRIIKYLPQNNLEDLILCTQRALTHKYVRDLETSGLPMPVITSVSISGLDKEHSSMHISQETLIDDVLPPTKRFALSVSFPGKEWVRGTMAFEYGEIRDFYSALIGDGKKNEAEIAVMKEYRSMLAGTPTKLRNTSKRAPTRFNFCPKSGIEVRSPPVEGVKYVEGQVKRTHLVSNEGGKTFINGIPVVRSMSCHRCRRKRTYCHVCYFNESHRVNDNIKIMMYTYILLILFIYLFLVF